MVGLFNLLISLHKIKSETEGTDKRQVFSLLVCALALARNWRLPDTGFLDFQKLKHADDEHLNKRSVTKQTGRKDKKMLTKDELCLGELEKSYLSSLSPGSLRLPGGAGICYAERTRML